MPLTADPTRLPIRARITLAVALALSVLVAVALVSYRSVGVLVDTSARVGHTHEVLATLESLLGGVITADTGVRGYVLTGEERFLGTYWSGMQRAEIGLAALRRLTADNREQQDRLAHLEPLLAERLLALQEISALRRGRGRGVAAARGRLTRGPG